MRTINRNPGVHAPGDRMRSIYRGSPAAVPEVKGKTAFVVPWMGIAALDLALETIGSKAWSPVNAYQKHWVQLFAKLRTVAAKFSDEELVRTWGKTAEEINEFLAEHGFPEVKLDPFPSDGRSFGVASVLKVLMLWSVPGNPTKLEVGGHDAVQMKRGVSFHRTSSTDEFIVKIETKNGDEFFMVMEDEPLAGFDLWNRGVALSKEALTPDREFNEVRFPMVSFDEFSPDAKQLVGLNTPDPDGKNVWDVVQVKEKVRFRMNEKGAKVEGAFAAEVRMRGMPAPPRVLEINRPFIAWVNRPGLSAPIMVARICPEHWKNPGAL